MICKLQNVNPTFKMIEANAHFAICEAFSKAEYMLQSKLHKNFMNIIAEISVNMNF